MIQKKNLLYAGAGMIAAIVAVVAAVMAVRGFLEKNREPDLVDYDEEDFSFSDDLELMLDAEEDLEMEVEE